MYLVVCVFNYSCENKFFKASFIYVNCFTHNLNLLINKIVKNNLMRGENIIRFATDFCEELDFTQTTEF